MQKVLTSAKWISYAESSPVCLSLTCLSLLAITLISARVTGTVTAVVLSIVLSIVLGIILRVVLGVVLGIISGIVLSVVLRMLIVIRHNSTSCFTVGFRLQKLVFANVSVLFTSFFSHPYGNYYTAKQRSRNKAD